MLVAVPFGSDGLAGDSLFYPSREEVIKATESSSFEELLSAWEELDQIHEEDKRPVGFWLVESHDLEEALRLWSDMDPCNDAPTYACNRAVKSILLRKAVCTIGAECDPES